MALVDNFVANLADELALNAEVVVLLLVALGASAIARGGGVRPRGRNLLSPSIDGEQDVATFDTVAPELAGASSVLKMPHTKGGTDIALPSSSYEMASGTDSGSAPIVSYAS